MENIRTETVHARPAISGLVVTLILVGVGAGMTFAALGGIQDNLGGLAGTNKVVIESVNAYVAGDRMVITGNLKNIGSVPLTSVTIDEITAGALVITQDGTIEDGELGTSHGNMELTGLANDGSASKTVLTSGSCTGGTGYVTGSGDFNFAATNAGTDCTASVHVTGLSTSKDNSEALQPGTSKSFRITIHGDSQVASSPTGPYEATLDPKKTVPASTKITITIAGTDGKTSTISDARSTNVKYR